VPTEKRFDWKHAPIVLFFIVLVNILTLFFYQSGDGEKLEAALDLYMEQELLHQEWIMVQGYLLTEGEEELVEQFRELYEEEAYYELSAAIITRTDFSAFLKEAAVDYLPDYEYEEWRIFRERIYAYVESTSYFSLGLIPRQLDPITLLSYQFLHGDVMHLMGNMFFLVICGFAVEAAIGHRLFLLFYLLTGVAGGLLYVYTDPYGSTPLVGASGSVSGVMAMYLGIFRLKKIEFFYWFYIFVGYFRAPALLILPFYIGKELWSYYAQADSNVAFMAHAGGFVAGGLLTLALALIRPRMMNQEYIEEDQDVDPVQNELARVYTAVGNLQFQSALKTLSELIDQHGKTFDRELLRYNLCKVDRKGDYETYVRSLLSAKKPSEGQAQKLEQVWLENLPQVEKLGTEEVLRLGMIFAGLKNPDTAEKIFKRLYEGPEPSEGLAVLARKLALVFAERKDEKREQVYSGIAEKLLGGAA
jgi:membrane associated rhomboid family serine protease